MCTLSTSRTLFLWWTAVLLFLKDFLFASDFLHRIATWQTFKASGREKLRGSG